MLRQTRTTRMLWAGFLAYRSIVFIVLYPVVLLLVPLLSPGQPAKAAYVLLLMAGFWLTEVVPIYVTALFPVLLAPMLGLIPSSQICPAYMKDTVMLFVGGLFVACTIEHRNLHRRIALSVLKVVGSDPKMLLLGVMLPSWFLSMWMSNTATTAMMITIVEAVLISLNSIDLAIQKINEQQVIGAIGEMLEITEDPEATWNLDEIQVNVLDKKSHRCHTKDNGFQNDESKNHQSMRFLNLEKFNKGLSLAVCYASTCGGLATVTGTAPNSILFGQVTSLYGQDTGLTFGSWMAFAIPISIAMLCMVWIILTLMYVGPKAFCSNKKDETHAKLVRDIMDREYEKLGSFTYAEAWCCILFALITLLWVTRNIGHFGWSRFFNSEERKDLKPSKMALYVTDTQPAILVALLAMVIPAASPLALWRHQYKRCKNPEETVARKNEFLLPWHVVHTRVPWGVIFVLGGGFALSDICLKSGLSSVIGDYLAVKVSSLPPVGLVAVFCFLAGMFTELTSNAATISILLPIILSLSESLELHPFLLAIPTTIATSFAFCLPAATPPNSIVFGRGRVKVIDMIKSGCILNLSGSLITIAATASYGISMFQMNTLPQWAMNTTAPVL